MSSHRSYILVTGGAGYIGSHTCITLLESGYDVIIFDNFSTVSSENIKRIEKIIDKSILTIEGDVRDSNALENLFQQYTIKAVLHFAGVKSVSESVSNPLFYYDNNVHGTNVLCSVMQKYHCKSLIFSSSATVYGIPKCVPIKENTSPSPVNPYGRSKLFVEDMLGDLALSDDEWKIIILRYFNPIGAHKSGIIGETPNGIPNNLMPYISQTAIGEREYLNVFGDDYDTHDGTGVRDYIHVMDVAEGHLKALQKLNKLTNIEIINLGTGKGYSVLDIVKVFENVSKKSVPYKISNRRAGDIAEYYADISYAEKILGWKSKRDIYDMCEDTWQWEMSQNNSKNNEFT